jgi:hypothetical protein
MRRLQLLSVIFLFAMSTLDFQCDKDDFYVIEQYEFFEKLALFPEKKAYAVTDTIWIEFIKQGKQLFDTKSNQTISFDTGSITAGIYLKPLYNAPQAPAGGYADFVVIDAVKADSFDMESTGVYVQKQCSEPDFHFRVGFILKYKGYYVLYCGRNAAVTCTMRPGETFAASISYHFDINDVNRDVFLQMPDSVTRQYASTWLDPGRNTKNVFVFRID